MAARPQRGARVSLVAVPLTLGEARAFVTAHHRHHRAPQGGLFAVGVAVACADLIVCGAAIVGRPVARNADNGWCAEVTRTAVKPDTLDPTRGVKDACSFLLGACWRAARALGYRRLITYTLKEESGITLVAAGWRCIGETPGGAWSRKSRPRVDQHPLQSKLIWEAP